MEQDHGKGDSKIQPALIAEGIIRFHDDLMFVLVFVSVFVAWIMGRCVMHFNEKANPTH